MRITIAPPYCRYMLMMPQGGANGSTDRFFIYGMDPNAPEDNDGPLITSLFLNSESFSDGMTTGPSPIVRAFVSDPSGINVSDAGIGHKITIDIDKKTYLNDVSLYFSPDESDPTAGEISYPLNALDPGEHTLTLTVWDNANNSSSASISFKVAAAWLPRSPHYTLMLIRHPRMSTSS